MNLASILDCSDYQATTMRLPQVLWWTGSALPESPLGHPTQSCMRLLQGAGEFFFSPFLTYSPLGQTSPHPWDSSSHCVTSEALGLLHARLLMIHLRRVIQLLQIHHCASIMATLSTPSSIVSITLLRPSTPARALPLPPRARDVRLNTRQRSSRAVPNTATRLSFERIT